MSPKPTSCEGCCACCEHMGHPTFFRMQGHIEEHWINLPTELKQEINDYLDAIEDDDLGEPCIWLNPETKKCQHYEHRPQVCRDFELGGYHCFLHRSRKIVELTR